MGELNYCSFSPTPDQQQHTPEPGYSPPSAHSHQASSAFLPSRTQCDIQTMMLPTTMAPEQPYMHQPGRLLQHGYDYTPHSAVSSFNAPAHCDSTLLTPVSMGGSPSLSTRSGSLIREDRCLTSSPTSHHWMPEDDDFRYNQPMKYKDPTNALQIHTDSGFPTHYNAPEPYFGHLGVSAPSNAGRVMALSPSVYHNTMISAGGYSNNSPHSQNSTPPLSASSTESWRSFDMPRSTEMIPVLHAAPNPLTLCPASRQVKIESRQNSVHSNVSSSSSASTQRPRKKRSPVSSSSDAISTRIKKEKKSSGSKDKVKFWEMAYPPNLTDEDKFILHKSQQGMEWKKLVVQFETKHNHPINVPAAQMRKKRLVDKIQMYNKQGKDSDSKSNIGSEYGSDYGSGPDGETWPSEWESMSKSPSDVRIKLEMDSTSPEARSPRSWQEPRSPFTTFNRSSSFPSLAPILPSIQATTTMDRASTSGHEAFQYYPRSLERNRQEEFGQNHPSQHQHFKEEHDVREQHRRR